MPDPDFLADCHAPVRAIYQYWASKRHGRLMPSRADLDPLDIPRLLPGLCLIDVVPDERRYVYRLIGTNEARVRGSDPTGRSVVEAYFGTSVQSVLLNYETVTRTRAPHLDREPSHTKDDRFIQHETIFLPLSDDGATVNMILAYSVYGPAPAQGF